MFWIFSIFTYSKEIKYKIYILFYLCIYIYTYIMANNNDNKTINNAMLRVETLEKEYDLVLKQYQEAYKNYTDTLNTNSKSTDSLGKEFSELPSRSWWGTYGIKEGAAKTKEECKSMCASDINCTGATFNTAKRYCWARGGDGAISTGTKDETALIPKLKMNLITLKGLNEKLISINQQLRNEIKNIEPTLSSENITNTKRQKTFDDSYYKLSNKKSEIQKLLKQYDTIEAELNDQSLIVDQANSSLKLWTFIAFIILLILLKQVYGVDSPSGIMMFITIILILIVLSFSLSKPSGFAAVGLVLIAVIGYKLNSSSSE